MSGGATTDRTHHDRTPEPTADPNHPADQLLLSWDSIESPTLSIVMPTLDEEAGITECIERAKNAVAALDVTAEIVISDSSSDRTPEIARDLGATVLNPDQDGYGYAYRYAFEQCRGDYIVMGDADTTYDFEELPKLFAKVADGSADIVMGSRLEGEIMPGSMPALHQYVGNPLLTKFLNVFYDAGVSDAHSGFRVFTRDAYERLNLESNGMEFASEMIMDAGARDLRIEEVPITYHEREGEATLDSFQDGWRHVRFMLENAPGYLFSVPGVAIVALGVFIMGVVMSGASVGGVTLGLHSMVAGSLMVLVGSQVGSLGVFASIASDPIRQPSDPITEVITEHFKLEHGATVGLLIFVAGAAYAGVLGAEWVTSGYTELPLLMSDIVALTAIVLGLQIVFSSFFLSVIGGR